MCLALLREIWTYIHYINLYLKNRIFLQHNSTTLEKLKSMLTTNEILIFPSFLSFSMTFFKILKFHNISMTGKVTVIFQFSRCWGNPKIYCTLVCRWNADKNEFGIIVFGYRCWNCLYLLSASVANSDLPPKRTWHWKHNKIQ